MLPQSADGQMPIALVVRGKCKKTKKRDMEYLDYLNYTLKRLSEKFSEGLILSNLRSEYKELSGEWIDTETQAHFESLYENEYFARIGTTYKHKISPKAKEIVDEFGSLSTYLELCELERNK